MPVARNCQNHLISMFAPSLNVCMNYMQEPSVSQLYKILAPPVSFVISVTDQERMKTGLKLPSRASVVRAGVTPL